ncbi:MAG: hypothetical protein AAB508_03150 [Patescibacteria group bacterium]
MKPSQQNHLYFLWDYNLTVDDVHGILHGTNETERTWMMSRILTNAAYEDVWKYLKLEDVVREFSKLRMRAQTTDAWRHALSVWGYDV